MKIGFRTSVLQLALIGFTIVVLPLIAVLVSTIVQVDQLSQRMKDAVFTAAQAVESSRLLLSNVISLERSARQYLVLDDHALLENYQAQSLQFKDVVSDLEGLFDDVEISASLEMLQRREGYLHDMIVNRVPEDEDLEGFLGRLPAIAEVARPLPFLIGRRINEQTERVNQEAYEVRRTLVVQAMAVIPLALVMAVIFGWIISRPLRQVAAAVRHLGSGDLTRPVSVSGPEDIRVLGERLEWMRNRLHELEEQKVLFLRHVSHELKTPLTAIREGVELMNDGVLGPLSADQAEVALILRSSSKQLQNQIENLLAFNIAMAEDILTAPEQVAVDALVVDVLEKQVLALRARGIQVVKHLKPALVQGDPDKLRTVIDNLVSNAIKHSPQGGLVGIRLSTSGDTVELDVVDQGPGIAEEDREYIFHAYFQGKNKAQSQVEGTGLGLAISRRFVDLHNGKIELLETRGGAHFKVTLPIRSDA